MHSETIDSADDSSWLKPYKASFHVLDTSTLESVDTLEGMRKQVDKLVLCSQVTWGKCCFSTFPSFYFIQTALHGKGRPLCD